MTHKRKSDRERQRIFLKEFSKVGVMSVAADKAEISLRTIAQWVQHDKTFYEDLHEAKLRFHDSLEAQALDLIAHRKDASLLRFKLQAELPDKYGRKQAAPKGLPSPAMDDIERMARKAQEHE